MRGKAWRRPRSRSAPATTSFVIAIVAVDTVAIERATGSMNTRQACVGMSLAESRGSLQPNETRMATYGKKAGDKVERAMKELHEGTLKSGRSGTKVTSRKQAIAIGLSEARAEGGKVPAAKKAAAKKAPAKKATVPRKAPAKKTAAGKAARRST
jgi:topoisomerase IA-like protein